MSLSLNLRDNLAVLSCHCEASSEKLRSMGAKFCVIGTPKREFVPANSSY
jgi:hypothetical protein